MMKTLVLLMAMALPLAIANAQGMSGAPEAVDGALVKCQSTGDAMPRAPQRKIEMDRDERLIGFYRTDDLPNIGSDGYRSLAYTGTWRLGALFENEVTEKAVGGEITRFRFALALSIPVSCAFVYAVDADHNVSGEPIAEIDLSGKTMQVGWNEVTLDEPIPVEDGVGYLVGYEYVQVDGEYPLVTDVELDTDYDSDYGIMGYGDVSGTTKWNHFTGAGHLCVQAVVKGGGVVDCDIVLGDLSVPRYVSLDTGTLDFSFTVRSDGRNVPDSYTLDVLVDGGVVATLDTPVGLATSGQVVADAWEMGDLPTGDHAFAVCVTGINGDVPTEATEDDVLESSFTVYEGLVERRMNLVEYFTSVACTYCPYGIGVLEQMQEDRPGEYTWVALHYDMSGTSDPYHISDADAVSGFVGVSGYPAGAFNRYVVTEGSLSASNSMSVGLGYKDAVTAAGVLESVVDRYNRDNPAFVSVDISTDYDIGTRELSIKVAGEGVSAVRELIGDDRLTVYLTEDSLVSRQFSNGVWRNNYVHENVLRRIVSTSGGDAMNWVGDAGYENDFTVTLDDGWDWENMHVVAFVNGPMTSRESAAVNNANVARIADGATGIRSVRMGGTPAESSRCTIDGRRVHGPVRGLNIVRMSDGSVRKVIVR